MQSSLRYFFLNLWMHISSAWLVDSRGQEMRGKKGLLAGPELGVVAVAQSGRP